MAKIWVHSLKRRRKVFYLIPRKHPFTVGNAYWTGGQVVAAEDAVDPATKNEEVEKWKEEVDDLAERAKVKAKEVGGKAIEKGKEVLRGLIDLLP